MYAFQKEIVTDALSMEENDATISFIPLQLI